MKRVICHHCDYPQSVCICDLLCTVCSEQKVIILQHLSEVNHAKNSAKLIQLCDRIAKFGWAKSQGISVN
ncbi:DTW domain-containing protein [Paraglaciecola sp. Hal342]